MNDQLIYTICKFLGHYMGILYSDKDGFFELDKV